VLAKGVVGLILVLGILFVPDGVMRKLQRRRRAEDVVPAEPAARVAAVAPRPAAIARSTSSEPLLRVQGLSKSFRGVRALSQVTLEVRRGEILGLLGPNGSGKSTFINTVTGHYLRDGGQVWLGGRDISGLPAHRIARAGIARTYQIPRPFGELTVLDNVAIAAMYAGAGCATLEAGRAEARRWLAFTHLDAKANALPTELNLHQRKFLELARALASRPQLVLLDEVLCGLTPTEINEAVALIRRIRDQGTTIVFVEHVMDAVMALTDRIVVFDQGEMLAEGEPVEVMQRPAVVSAYLGVAYA
jgi:branched-chain amino acid transport system permease protein